jgi:succinate dehydrogenase / fumarate reductase cytochrome b subunit
VGQWSWLIHRVTGLGIALFLVVHIIDTFLVVAYPAEYDFTVAIYGGTFAGQYYWPLRWGFRVAELALIACVAFHAVNGVRIVLIDFWPRASLYQKPIFGVVMAVFLAIMIPVTVVVCAGLAAAPVAVPVPVPVPASVSH